MRKPSVQQSEYEDAGRFPIVDQGAAPIGGYTDNELLVHDHDLPIILFGDHTRVFKFLDFPFAAGADGTKLLRANDELVDAKFLYYGLRHLDIPSRGYSRHFKYLKDLTLAVPSARYEQQAIATVLTTIEAAIEVHEKLLTTLKGLSAATMAKVFREGLRGEPLKQTEVGEIPESWEVVRLGDFCDISSGGTPPRDNPTYWNGGIPWVKTAEIDYRPIGRTEEHITREGLDHSSAKLVPKGTLLMAMYGQGVTRGKVAFLEIEAATNQACAALFPREGLDSGYLYAFCSRAYDTIRNFGHGANQKNLSAEIIRSVLLPRPTDLEEQQAIFQMLSVIQSRLEAAEGHRESLGKLFSSMLHLLMTGQIRVPAEMVARLGGGPDASAPARTGGAAEGRKGGRPGEAVLQEIVRRIVEAVAPEKIILFGSAARGKMGPDSDLDLLVVKACEHRREVARAIRACLRGVAPGRGKDVVVVTPADVERDADTIGYVIRPALREGRVLYAA